MNKSRQPKQCKSELRKENTSEETVSKSSQIRELHETIRF